MKELDDKTWHHAGICAVNHVGTWLAWIEQFLLVDRLNHIPIWCVVLCEGHVCYPLHEQELIIITHTIKTFLRLAISVRIIISAKILDTNTL